MRNNHNFSVYRSRWPRVKFKHYSHCGHLLVKWRKIHSFTKQFLVLNVNVLAWINNCVGHFNHRYFFLFCVYMCLGTIYVSLTLLPTFFDHINFIARDVSLPLLKCIVVNICNDSRYKISRNIRIVSRICDEYVVITSLLAWWRILFECIYFSWL